MQRVVAARDLRAGSPIIVRKGYIPHQVLRQMQRDLDRQDEQGFYVRNRYGQNCRVRTIMLGNLRLVQRVCDEALTQPQQQTVVFRVWEPEGLLLTPRTAEAPWGYGPPRRSLEAGAEQLDLPGTQIEAEEDERLNQVLINRFSNNKLGDPDFRVPQRWNAAEFEDEDEEFSEFADPQFYPVRPGGMSQAQPWMLVQEGQDELEEGEVWLVHWPAEAAPESAAEDAAFLATNALRTDEDLPPLHRPLEGFANAAFLVVVENVAQPQPGDLNHNSDQFRTGSRLVSNRIAACVGDGLPAWENVALLTTQEPDSAATGQQVVQGWRDSPGHYANILAAEGGLWWSGGLVGQFDGAGPPLDTTFPLAEGSVFAQVMIDQRQWLQTGAFVNWTNWGPVSCSERGGSFLYTAISAQGTGVYYRGQAYYIKSLGDAKLEENLPFDVLGAGIRERDGRLWLVAITHEQDRLRAWTKPVAGVGGEQTGGFASEETLEWQHIDDLQLGDDWGPVTRASFAPDGEKAVLTILVPGSQTVETFMVSDQYTQPTYLAHKHVRFEDDELTVGPEVAAPEMHYDLDSELIDGGPSGRVTRYAPNCNDVMESWPYYDSDGELQYIQWAVFVDIVQGLDLIPSYDISMALTIPGHETDEMVSMRALDHELLEGCFFSHVLHLDPVTGTLVQMRVDCEQRGSQVWSVSSLRVGDRTVKEWPERVLYYADVNGDFGANFVGDPSEGTARQVYDLGSFATYARGRSGHNNYFSPGLQTWTDTSKVVKCGNKPDGYRPGKLIATSHPICMRTKQAHVTTCTNLPTKDAWSLSCAIPVVGFSQPEGAEWMDQVQCWLAEYKDEHILQAKVLEFWRNELDGNEDIVIDSSLDLNALIDIGDLTRIDPMGVT